MVRLLTEHKKTTKLLWPVRGQTTDYSKPKHFLKDAYMEISKKCIAQKSESHSFLRSGFRFYIDFRNAAYCTLTIFLVVLTPSTFTFIK